MHENAPLRAWQASHCLQMREMSETFPGHCQAKTVMAKMPSNLLGTSRKPGLASDLSHSAKNGLDQQHDNVVCIFFSLLGCSRQADHICMSKVHAFVGTRPQIVEPLQARAVLVSACVSNDIVVIDIGLMRDIEFYRVS